MDENSRPLLLAQEYVVDPRIQGAAPLGTTQPLMRASFDYLERVDQYTVAKAVYQYLESTGIERVRLVVLSPEVLLKEHRGTWVEYYLARAIVEATTPFMGQIIENARATLAKQIEQLAKEAEEEAQRLHDSVKNDRDFRARLAMDGLGIIAKKEKENQTS